MRMPIIWPIIALALGGASPPAAAPPLAQGLQERQQVNQAFDQLIECQRSAPGLKHALMAALWQVDDNLRLRFGDAGSKAVQASGNPTAPACDSQEDRAILFLSHKLGFEWLTRLAVIKNASLQGGWSSNIAAVPQLPGELEALRKQLGANLASAHGVQAVEGMAQQIARETQVDLALICDARKDIRSKSPRACPQLTPDLLQHREFAASRVANLELMATRILESNGVGQQGDNPFGVPFGYYVSTDFARWISRYSIPCMPQQAVVYLTDPAAIRNGDSLVLPQRAFGSGEITGKATVKPDNSAYALKLTIVGLQTEAVLSPFQTEAEFVRCPNQQPK
jgi:hypothetical protein